MIDAVPLDTRLVDRAFAVHGAIAGSPRVAWGVAVDGALVHAGGHDADADAAFRIASMTKSFTAATVLLLRDEGALALDDPVARHAPELGGLRGPTADSPPITIRHLLTMTSGLATDDPWADRNLDLADDELDAIAARGARFAHTPGVAYEYSNLGYGMLGRAVARVSGMGLQDVVRTRLLEPLRMQHTAWTADALPAGTDVAPGWRLVDGARESEPPVGDGAIAPMGGLYSTVRDLATWSTYLADAFPPRDDADDGPLSRSSRREMQRIWTAMPPERRVATDGRRRRPTVGYGMGIVVHDLHGVGTVLGHSGGLPGYGSAMRWTPGRGVAVVALANSTYAPMTDAALTVIELLARRGMVPRHTPPVAPAVVEAAERLVALLDDWDDARADALLADNVLADDSAERRRTAAAKLREEHGGGFVIERIEPEGDAAATVRVRGARTSFIVELDLAPLPDIRIQHYSVD